MADENNNDLPKVSVPKTIKIKPKVQESSRLDKTVSFSFSPRKGLRALLFIALILGIFFIGRLSTESFPSTLTGLTGFAVVDEPEVAVEAEVIEEPEVVEAAPVEEPEPVAEPEPEPEPEVEEEIITKYKRVALSVNEVNKQWKGTWGKVISLDYTIKNGETGTVLPDHLVMTMEGYPEYEKEVGLTSASKKIKAGKTVEGTVSIPKGFAYNPNNAGDLSSVRLTVYLVDGNGKTMTHFYKDFDLSG